MFRCLKCKKRTNLPICEECGFRFEENNMIFNLTYDPNMQINDETLEKYIGFDDIGELYKGKYWYEITNRDYAIGKELANIINNGILLDLACGDGSITLPIAKFGTKVIATDISKKMLSLLIKKAKYNSINLRNVSICRMNALNIQLMNDSVDFVVANGLLHLISNPNKVISEIYRVLKPGGKVIELNGGPGNKEYKEIDENKEYFSLLNEFRDRYWELLNIDHINKQKLSWEFNKSKEYEKIFGNKLVYDIDFTEERTISLEEDFIHRFARKGFSSQATVPEKNHMIIYNKVINEFLTKYGKDFMNIKQYRHEKSIRIEMYEKV